MRHYRLHTHVKLFALPELIAFLRSALAFHRAHMSNTSPVRSSGARSSFSGLFTRVEMGHIVIGSEG